MIIILERNMINQYIESETLELKKKYTDTITKEIVSFLNGEQKLL